MSEVFEGQGWVATEARSAEVLALLDRIRALADAEDASQPQVLDDRLGEIRGLLGRLDTRIEQFLEGIGRPPLDQLASAAGESDPMAAMLARNRAQLHEVALAEREKPDQKLAALDRLLGLAGSLQTDILRLEAEGGAP